MLNLKSFRNHSTAIALFFLPLSLLPLPFLHDLNCAVDALAVPPVTNKGTPPPSTPSVRSTNATYNANALCPNGSATPNCRACYDFCPISPFEISSAVASTPFGTGDQCFCMGNIPWGFATDEEHLLLGKWISVDRRDFLLPLPPDEALMNPTLKLWGWWRSLSAEAPNSAISPRADLTGVTITVEATLVTGEVVTTVVPVGQPGCIVDLASTNDEHAPAHVVLWEIPLIFPSAVTFTHTIIKVPTGTNECFTAAWRAYLIPSP